MKNKFPALLCLLVFLLLCSSAASAAFLYRYSRNLGIYSLISISALGLITIITALFYSRNSIRHFSKMNSHLEKSAAEYMNSLPAPIAVLENNGTLVWYNQIFSEEIALGNDVYGLDVRECMQINIDAVLNDGFSICPINNKFFKISSEKFEKNGVVFYILYFHDETEYFNYKKNAEESQQNVLVINIDNYDEIMQNAKESDKARTSVETEQLIENFMNGTNGIVKKTSANMFYVILDNKHLNEVIDGKFKILDGARNIRIGDRFSLTLSIGVGQGATNLSESEKLAKHCLDMALGRGGDQAVVKSDGSYRFFGGVSKGIEKKSRSKTRIIANTLQEIIKNSGKVYIMGHRFGDLDSIGAATGLAGAVKLLGKEAYIAVDYKKNLATHLIDMIRSILDEDIYISPSVAADNIESNDLLIIVDTHNKDFIESKNLYNNAKKIVVIDHHRKTVNFIDNAVIFHHEPYASSASEMVTELIQYFNFEHDALPSSYYADALLAGIALDTKNFVMRTGVRTFEAAAFLRKLGADTVNVKLMFSNSIDAYRRKTQIVASAKIHNKCAIAIADFKSDDIRLTAPQAADELLGITDVDASFVIYKTGDVTNISARSLGAMNVQIIMELLGGGGHQTMAAAQINNVSTQEAYKLLLKAIDDITEN